MADNTPMTDENLSQLTSILILMEHLAKNPGGRASIGNGNLCTILTMALMFARKGYEKRTGLSLELNCAEQPTPERIAVAYRDMGVEPISTMPDARDRLRALIIVCEKDVRHRMATRPTVLDHRDQAQSVWDLGQARARLQTLKEVWLVVTGEVYSAPPKG